MFNIQSIIYILKIQSYIMHAQARMRIYACFYLLTHPRHHHRPQLEQSHQTTPSHPHITIRHRTPRHPNHQHHRTHRNSHKKHQQSNPLPNENGKRNSTQLHHPQQGGLNKLHHKTQTAHTGHSHPTRLPVIHTTRRQTFTPRTPSNTRPT
jgi:hypothetical protein